ncbi:MAG TPA: ABC transporter permease [Segeticoccus sp.]|nr:ABC transporter permease [Segeticoccus sp.]
MTERTGTGGGGPSPRRRGRPRSRAHRSIGGYLAIPAVCGAILLAAWLAVASRASFSTAERQQLPLPTILVRTWEHIELTVVSTVIVLLIAVPLGILLTRPLFRPVTRPTVAVFSVGQAIPSIGLIALLAVAWTQGYGFWAVIIALVIYTVIPVLANTMVGLEQVDESVIESARGMGITKWGVLWQVEMPLAVPVIMAGLRTALTLNVGTATLATFVGGGGLGGGIVAGIGRDLPLVTLVYAACVAVLALLIDYLAGIAEDVLRPRGL